MTITTVSRIGFSWWLIGDINGFACEKACGKGCVPDEMTCAAADKALKEGKTVFLKDNAGKIVSRMENIAGCFLEFRLDDEDRKLLAAELIA